VKIGDRVSHYEIIEIGVAKFARMALSFALKWQTGDREEV
jgi:hypothetical protein